MKKLLLPIFLVLGIGFQWAQAQIRIAEYDPAFSTRPTYAFQVNDTVAFVLARQTSIFGNLDWYTYKSYLISDKGKILASQFDYLLFNSYFLSLSKGVQIDSLIWLFEGKYLECDYDVYTKFEVNFSNKKTKGYQYNTSKYSNLISDKRGVIAFNYGASELIVFKTVQILCRNICRYSAPRYGLEGTGC